MAGSSFGPWGTAIGAGVGALSSFMGASGAAKAQEEEQRKQAAMQQQEMDLRRAMYEKESRYIDPIRERLTAEAMSSQPLDYAAMAAQVKKNYADAQRKFAGIGNSGVAGAALRGSQLGQASALGDAYAQGMAARRGLQQNLLGRDQSNQLGMGLAGGYGNMASGYGQQANMYGQAAQQGWQNFGSNLGGLAYGLGSMRPVASTGYVPSGGATAPSAYGFGSPTTAPTDYGSPAAMSPTYPINPVNLNSPYGGQTGYSGPVGYGNLFK